MIHPKAVLYSNGSQESERAEQFLRSQNFEFTTYKLNHHFTQRAFEQEFGEDATYPQISIGSKHIGSLKETLQDLYLQRV
jgi:glutaredoxin